MLVPSLIAILISSVTSQSVFVPGHPQFDQPMEQIVLLEGFFDTIGCVARGELPLNYTWYNQNDTEITSDANRVVFTQSSENVSSLIFTEVKDSHAGLYSCSATNKHGTATKIYDVTVNVTSGNITTNETEGIGDVKILNITENSVEFFVRTTGNPIAFFVRYKEELDREEKHVQILRGRKAVVKDLVPSGRYQFRFQIESPYLIRRELAPYYVTLLPGLPDVIFRTVKDGFVAVEWFRSHDDSMRKTIDEHELSYSMIQQSGGRYWKASECAVTIKIPFEYCSPNKYTVAGLEKGIYYEIRLRAKTSAGYGKPYINKVYIL